MCIYIYTYTRMHIYIYIRTHRAAAGGAEGGRLPGTAASGRGAGAATESGILEAEIRQAPEVAVSNYSIV